MDTLNRSELRHLDRGFCKESWITLTRKTSEHTDAIGDVLDFLQSSQAHAVSIRLFGPQSDLETAAAAIEAAADNTAPLQLTQNTGDRDRFSLQIHAVTGVDTEPLYCDGVCIGQMFRDAQAEYYMFNVLPDRPDQSPYAQAQQVFQKARRILRSVDLDFSSTIRTWLYARDILSWYDQLNKARNEFFTEHKIYDGIVPASTGIGAGNPFDAALTTQFLAVRPLTDAVTIEPANSPLQNPAWNYKSSFSRGIKVLCPDHHRLSVSGTASIDEDGKTVFIDDVDAQMNLTMQVVEAILQDAGMDWNDTASALVYFKHRDDFGRFDAYCQKHGIALPHVKLHADVCRDDLLFELELDAVKTV